MWKQFLPKLPRKSRSDPSAAAAAKRASSSAVFPSTVVAGIEPLVSFSAVSSADRPNLFLSKLALISAASPAASAKRQALLDLIDFVAAAPAHFKFSESIIAETCRMFEVNLFRVFPPSYRAGSAGEGDEDEPLFDPMWSHLQLVYELLLKFISSPALEAKVGKKYINHGFIGQMLDLFDSEDPRERDSVKTVLHRVYGKFMVHRPFIRKAVSNIFYRFVFETERFNGISELLEVFGSVITGYAVPLKEEHRIFLVRVLIPLHKPKGVGVYLQQLTYCVTQFIEKDPKLASVVVRGLLKYWPVTNCQKEVMFFSELEEVLESTSVVEFQRFMVPLFRRVACCINSSHFQVAERALFLWNNDHVIGLIAQNRQVIMPLIFPALERNARNHWNQSVQNLTMNVRKLLSEMDEDLFLACQKKYEEEEYTRAASEENRRLKWERLETVAASRPVIGQTAVLV